MMHTKQLFVFRHGQTDWNLNKRLQGSTDIPLNDTGREQALALKGFFDANPVEAFFSSDLIRARETAEIARGGRELPIILSPHLRENALGEAEGMTLDEVAARFGADAWARWSGFGPQAEDFTFPGGEKKSVHTRRVLDALEAFLHETEFQRIGVSTHGGTLRRLIHHLTPDLTEGVIVHNCAIFEFQYDTRSCAWVIDPKPRC